MDMDSLQTDFTNAAIGRKLGGIRSRRRLAALSRQLLNDILAVLSDIRPSFLLDYIDIDPQDVVWAVEYCYSRIAHAIQSKNQHLVVLTWREDPSCIVADMKLIKNSPCPLFIKFDHCEETGRVVPRWAVDDEQISLSTRLRWTIDAIMARSGTHVHIPIINIDEIYLSNVESIEPIRMPTLNGCLLGYPVSYVVDTVAGAQAASRSLSATTLRLIRVFTHLMVQNDGENGENEVLFSFSLPVDLELSAAWQQKRQEWQDETMYRHASAIDKGFCWSRVSIKEISCMRSIAL